MLDVVERNVRFPPFPAMTAFDPFRTLDLDRERTASWGSALGLVHLGMFVRTKVVERGSVQRARGRLMATASAPFSDTGIPVDALSGTPRANAIDRWIYVFTAASFIAITLAGFIPDSFARVAAVRAGERPPFAPILHLHAVLMGLFLLLLLLQTTLAATGRIEQHRRMGLIGIVLAPALVVVGFLLVPTFYHSFWDAAHSGLPGAMEKFGPQLNRQENTLLLQLRIGLLFSLFVAIAIRARGLDAGLHKRMMILATAIPMPAAINRIPWLWTTMPASPISIDIFTLVTVSPMIIWDLFRNRRVHRAYWIWFGVFVPASILLQLFWNTPFWHFAARRIMGV